MTVTPELLEKMNEVNKGLVSIQTKNDELEAQIKKNREDSLTRGELDKMQESQDRLEKMVGDLQAEITTRRHFAGQDPERNANDAAFNIVRAIRALKLGPIDENGKEIPEARQMFRVLADSRRLEISQRSLIDDTVSGGSYLLPPTWANDFISLLTAQEVFPKLGVRQYSGLSGDLKMPRQLTGCSASMAGYTEAEGREVNASGLTMEQMTLEPHKMVVICPIGNELILRSLPTAQQIVQTDMVKAIKLLSEYQYLLGSGSTVNIQGIKNISNVASVSMGTDGGKLTTATNWDNLVSMIDEVENNNGTFEAYVFNARVRSNIRLIKNTLNEYIMTPGTNAGAPPALFGYPYFICNQIPWTITQGAKNDTTMAFGGMWSEAMVANWNTMTIAISNEASYLNSVGTLVSAFSRDETVIRITLERDFNLRAPNTMCKLVGIRDRNAS